MRALPVPVLSCHTHCLHAHALLSASSCSLCGPHPPAHAAADVLPSVGVVTPKGHLVQLPAGPVPSFHSPMGQGATTPGILR